jgi:hypothetical protein
MEAKLDGNRFASGQSARLSISGVEEREGVFRHEVKLATEDGALIRLPVSGYVDPPVYFDPPAVTIRGVLVGETASRKAPLHLAESVHASSLRVQVPPDAPLRVHIEALAGGGKELNVEFTGTAKPGWHYYEIVAEVDSRSTDSEGDPPEGDAAVAKLLIAIEVLPAVTIFPESVWLRDGEIGTEWTRSIRVESHGPHGLSIAGASWSDERFGQAIEAKVTQSSPTETLLRLSPKHEAVLRDLSGETAFLLLKGDNMNAVSIPVSIGGESSLDAARSTVDSHAPAE